MSQFPAYKPSARTFEAPVWPMTSFVSMSGKETRVLTGDTASTHSISLQFANVQESRVNAILAHWAEQKGMMVSFTLPETLWAGWPQYEAAIEPDLKWRYAAAPSVNSVSLGIFTVSVRLVSLS